MTSVRYVAIGDSFTEGVGDELPGGIVRGWADLVAEGWATGLGEPIEYANLAIRGRLARPILEQQLEPALALKPTHLSFNGGGNDMLRPRTPMTAIVDVFAQVLRRCDEEGVQLILLSGANPSPHLPLGRLIKRRGDLLSEAVTERFADRTDIIRALNWPDEELSKRDYWSEDRLHMNARGHHRVAARVLTALGVEPPAEWWSLPAPQQSPAARERQAAYYREHVAPWVMRRLTGRSSGDMRKPKFGAFTTVRPAD
ncbi:SGNH/GDSL hydrolase family protein [Naasia sp. SYSU D00057]|uniref:SGNH/GDSL hydrolase family protein n=1 Tax=Naasia sp. SYSU D00057 TaxID=2817380 RepID=UPI001B30A983|nr:SGNH/GDSL hydrolase family protein [Naasia sp. SYSU D00057]